MKALLVLLFLSLLASPVQAVLMTLERPRIQAGGQLDMLVETRTSRAEEPELTWPRAWEEHLELLHQEHQVERLRSGFYQHRWQLRWQHRDPLSRARQLQLPPLRVDGRAAQSLQLDIQAARRTPQPLPRLSSPLEMEHRVDRTQVYPGEALLYELIIRYQGYPREPRLSPLTLQGGQSRNLGEGREEGFNQRGVTWQEARWREVIQVGSGDSLLIEPRYFSSRLDFAGQGRGERHQAEVSAIELELLPLPQEWPASAAWLPAQGLAFQARWQGSPNSLQKDQPLELIIELDALGQQARNLPLFQAQDFAGLRVETLGEQRRDRVIDGYLTASLTQRLLVYPQQEGHLTLPDLKVHWWDTGARQLQTETVRLPPLFVQRSPGQAAPPPTATTATVAETSPPNWWRVLLTGLAVGGLLALALLAWSLYQAEARQRLKRALKQGPETWDHAQLLALVRELNLEQEAQPLLIQAAGGNRLHPKQISDQLLKPRKAFAAGRGLPPLNP